MLWQVWPSLPVVKQLCRRIELSTVHNQHDFNCTLCDTNHDTICPVHSQIQSARFLFRNWKLFNMFSDICMYFNLTSSRAIAKLALLFLEERYHDIHPHIIHSGQSWKIARSSGGHNDEKIVWWLAQGIWRQSGKIQIRIQNKKIKNLQEKKCCHEPSVDNWLGKKGCCPKWE